MKPDPRTECGPPPTAGFTLAPVEPLLQLTHHLPLQLLIPHRLRQLLLGLHGKTGRNGSRGTRRRVAAAATLKKGRGGGAPRPIDCCIGRRSTQHTLWPGRASRSPSKGRAHRCRRHGCLRGGGHEGVGRSRHDADRHAAQKRAGRGVGRCGSRP